MFYNILDKKRRDVLPLLRSFRDTFYLSGGTALALQIGHRDSIDFDFFTPEDFSQKELFSKIEDIFSSHTIKKTQDEVGTLSVIIDNDIKLSFFHYPYRLITDIIEEDNLRLASLQDISAMKLQAITSRATNKDYIDIYYLLQEFDLKEMIIFVEEKYSDLDIGLVLKSLAYFDDLVEEPIMFTSLHDISINDVKKTIVTAVEKYLH